MYSAFKHNNQWEESERIRSNITFKMENETEKVSFSNWRAEGVASNDYNDKFSYMSLEQNSITKNCDERYNDIEDIEREDI